VFDNKTLEAIAEYAPEDRSALAAVPGIGPKKLELYGDEVLDLLRR
jgi:DNA helicase-2/ATP-dependent DNA helicase PcrA